MDRSITITVLAIAITITGAACGGVNAHVAQGDYYGGEIVMTGAYYSSVADAQAVMAEHCRGRFYVVGPDSSAGAPERLDHPTADQETAQFVCLGRSRPATVQALTARSPVPAVSAAPAAADVTAPPQLIASP